MNKTSHSSYAKALAELLSKETNPKLGLERMRKLISLLKIKRSAMRIIQVVGTNGKGSSVAFIESVLNANNYSTGLFTSPHLSSARERIRINGCLISEEQFVQAAHHVNALCEPLADQPSFFERILAMALWLFSKEGLELVIVEAGLGGRLDATTALDPDILGITSIALDHQHILGDSVEKIAQEKIAAARKDQQVISVKQEASVWRIFQEAKRSKGFKLFESPLCEEPLGLYGEHQKLNAGLALALIKALNIPCTKQDISKGLLHVKWPGRFEIIRDKVAIILDGAHNPSGLKALAKALTQHPEFSSQKPLLVFGSLRGQAQEKIQALLKNIDFEKIIIHTPHNPRAESFAELKAKFLAENFLKPLGIFTNWQDIITQALKLNTYILVCGSLYTIGEVRSELLGIKTDFAAPNF